MNRKIFLTLALVPAALALLGAGRAAGRGGRPAAGRGGGATMYRRHRVAVPRATMPSARSSVSGKSRAVYPEKDETGSRITQRAATAPPAQHAAVMRNASFGRDRASRERTETTPNHYYWHNDGGMRYSHYYDGHNHWYGFYHGTSFYWTRFYGNRWWWADPASARWVFWANGFWWWSGPGGVPYVYIDNGYYPYEDAGVAVEQVEPQERPAVIPAANGGGSSTKSPNGQRLVQVLGADGEAFLYDENTTPPSFLNYLGKNVSKVRFSGGTSADAPLQVLVEFKDDTFALFDADGKSQSAAIKTDEASQAPPAAASPPVPSSAPGQ